MGSNTKKKFKKNIFMFSTVFLATLVVVTSETKPKEVLADNTDIADSTIEITLSENENRINDWTENYNITGNLIKYKNEEIQKEMKEKRALQIKKEAEQKAKEEAERKEKEELERKAKEKSEKEAKARAEEERKQKELEAQAKAEKEAEEKAIVEAEASAKEENKETQSQNTSNDEPSGTVYYMESTAYSSDGNDPLGGGTVTAMGTSLLSDPMQVAVDPSVIPLGSKVWVEGYGYATANDTGGAIKGNILDVHFSSTSQANAWGRKYNVKVIVLD